MRRVSTAGTAALALSVLVPSASTAATPGPDTVAAWNVYVAATETRIADELRVRDHLDLPSLRRPCLLDTGDGEAVGVRDGTITHWRGAVLVPGITLDALLTRLRHPEEHASPQDDVLALRVLARDPQGLTLYLRLARRSIVTAIYDTEHAVTFARHGEGYASSRSVSTRIEGDDRGFLWRMNAYWRYTETDSGVFVELEALTLSRGIPLGLGPVVRPVVNRIARDSMRRTLDGLRRAHGVLPAGGAGCGA
jgi:hypothetical protein